MWVHQGFLCGFVVRSCLSMTFLYQVVCSGVLLVSVARCLCSAFVIPVSICGMIVALCVSYLCFDRVGLSLCFFLGMFLWNIVYVGRWSVIGGDNANLAWPGQRNKRWNGNPFIFCLKLSKLKC